MAPQTSNPSFSSLPYLLFLLFLCLPAAAQEASSASRPKLRSLRGKHFELCHDLADPAAAQQALTDLAGVWSAATKLFGASRRDPKKLLRVYLYSTIGAYEQAELRLTKGRFRRNLAFSHQATLSSHIAVQPPLPAEVLAKIGLPLLTRRMLVHEATHLVAYATYKNALSHPLWLSEGLATRLTERYASQHSWLGESPQQNDPFSDRYAVQCLSLLDADQSKLPPPAKILSNDWGELGHYQKYAVQTLFFRFLDEQHGDALGEMLRGRVRGLRGGPAFTKRLAKYAIENLRSKTGLAHDWTEFVRRRRPFWDETARSLEWRPRGLLQIGFRRSAAMTWCRGRVLRDGDVLSGAVELLAMPGKGLYLKLGRTKHGFYAVTLYRSGLVRLSRYDTKSQKWSRLRQHRGEAWRAARPFRVKVSRAMVSVWLAGQRVIHASGLKAPSLGVFGLEAEANAGGWWMNLRVNDKPLRPARR